VNVRGELARISGQEKISGRFFLAGNECFAPEISGTRYRPADCMAGYPDIEPLTRQALFSENIPETDWRID